MSQDTDTARVVDAVEAAGVGILEVVVTPGEEAIRRRWGKSSPSYCERLLNDNALFKPVRYSDAIPIP